jgi:ABC-type branched-subunit amino acid transport system substrate-binding protein
MKWFHTCLLAAAVTWTAGTARAQILIGQTVGLTGPVAATVKEAVDGARLYHRQRQRQRRDSRREDRTDHPR